MEEKFQLTNFTESVKKPAILALALFLAGLFVLALGVGIFFFSGNSSQEIEIISAEGQKASSEAVEVVVDVSGAVARPGVYTLSANLRVNDAIAAAGGIVEGADTSKINLAAKIGDGQKIYVPASGEVTSDKGQGISRATGLVNINSASESELDTLPGVGPVTAQKIIAARPYSALEELLSKKAVGSSTFEKIKNLITF